MRSLIAAALVFGLLAPAQAFGAVAGSGTRLQAMSFSNANTGYIAGGFMDGSTSKGVVARSVDGGATWRATIVPRWLYGVGSSEDGASATAVSHFKGDYVFDSTDSGESWTPTTVSNSDLAAYYDAAYLDGGRRVLLGEWKTNANMPFALGAAPWQRGWFGPIYTGTGETPDPNTRADFVSADVLPGGLVAWAVGNDRTAAITTPKLLVSKTTNGGSTWTTATAGASTSEITCVAAGSDQAVFIGRVNGYLWRSTNGGTSWESKYVGSLTLRAIDAFDANNVVVVGDGGKIYKSTNAAQTTPTWTSVASTTTNALRGIHMFSPTSWIVIGDNETILRTTNAGASWTGPKALVRPDVALTAPAAGFSISSPLGIAGTSSDVGIGVALVQVALQRQDGQYWNGSGWTATQTWRDATTADGWQTWNAPQTIGNPADAGGGLVVWARSRDGMGQYSTAKTVLSDGYTALGTTVALAKTSLTTSYGAKTTVSGSLKSGSSGLTPKTVQLKRGSTVVASTTTGSGGAFSFYFLPSNVATTYTVAFPGDAAYAASSANVKITPRASIGRPVAPTAKRNKTFTTYAYIWPKHSSGAGGSKFYFYKYQKLSNGKYGYVYRKSATASTVNSSSYPTKSKLKARVKLPAGKWRVRVRHTDTGHAETYSTFDYFRVK